jgi:tyrosyl-tRNA synthetase
MMIMMDVHPFLKESQERGFLYQSSDLEGLSQTLSESKKSYAYVGFDATAKSLQVGNLVPILWARLLQKHGITPIILLGGATTLIGDPTGKDESRKVLTIEEVDENLKNFKRLMSRFINFDNAILVNNKDWLKDLNYMSFLRDFAPHFSVNYMMSLDSVKLRLSRHHHMSFLEFNYMIFQAYDFWHLFKTYGCMLQMGGSDQWANMICGAELIRRLEQKRAFVITAPLMTTNGGQKMGKTAGGAIWLDEQMTSPYDYWQFWRNTHDDDVEKCLQIFTDLPSCDIKSVCAHKKGCDINELKILLADHATTMCHGANVLKDIHQKIASFFDSAIDQIERINVPDGLCLDDLLIELKACSSKGEAKRLVQGSGVFIDKVTQDNPKRIIHIKDKPQKLSVGKKKHFWI